MNKVLLKEAGIFNHRHHEVMDRLEKIIDEGKSYKTMADLASMLKVSLRTLYEIAPSKDELINLTINNVLTKHGKIAMEKIQTLDSPIEKLRVYLNTVNQAVGPRFEKFTLSLSKKHSTNEMIDFHENYITNFIKSLLDDAVQANEIANIDTEATALALGGLGRYFQNKKIHSKSSLASPEDASNFLSDLILSGLIEKQHD